MSFLPLNIHGPIASQLRQRTRIELPTCEQSKRSRDEAQNGQGFAFSNIFILRKESELFLIRIIKKEQVKNKNQCNQAYKK